MINKRIWHAAEERKHSSHLPHTREPHLHPPSPFPAPPHARSPPSPFLHHHSSPSHHHLSSIIIIHALSPSSQLIPTSKPTTSEAITQPIFHHHHALHHASSSLSLGSWARIHGPRWARARPVRHEAHDVPRSPDEKNRHGTARPVINGLGPGPARTCPLARGPSTRACTFGPVHSSSRSSA